jgi:hypothetical protein
MEEDASERDKKKMFKLSPLLEQIDQLVYGNSEFRSTTIEAELKTMDEYFKALVGFSEDEYAAFLMGVGANWLNLQYWGIRNLEFQDNKIEKYMTFNKQLESNALTEGKTYSEKQHPYTPYPFTHINNAVTAKDSIKCTVFFRIMMQVLSARSF